MGYTAAAAAAVSNFICVSHTEILTYGGKISLSVGKIKIKKVKEIFWSLTFKEMKKYRRVSL